MDPDVDFAFGFIVFAVNWVLIAVTAAVIATGKGRNGAGWLFPGLFISIYAVIMVAFLPRLDEEGKVADAP